MVSEKRKPGRPAQEHTKKHMTFRADQDTLTILNAYLASRPNITRNEAINRGIKRLKHDLKNK